MKDTEFKKIIDGKDFTKPEDVQAALAGINAFENSLLERKESSFNEKLEAYKTEQAKESQIWKNKAYVYKNINNQLDDEGMSDFMAAVNARMATNNKLKFEDAAQAVSKRWLQNNQPVEQPKVEARPQPVVEEVKPQPVVEEVKSPSYGVRANSNISVGEDMTNNSNEAQLDRYLKYIGRK